MSNETQTPIQNTFAILDARAGELVVRLEKLNKRAAKLGLSPVATHIEGVTLPYSRRYAGGHIERFPGRIHVRVMGGRPVIPGWRFLGTLQHLGEANVIRGLPGETIPAEYRTKKAWCDHCQTSRMRKDSYLVLEEATGRIVQLGRNCIQDFLPGRATPQSMAQAMEYWAREIGGLSEFSGGGKDTVSTMDVLEFAACAVRTKGWVSKAASQACEGLQTTSSLVKMNLERPSEELLEHFRKHPEDRLSPSEEDLDVAAKTVDWAKTKMGDSSDYLHNLAALLSTPREIEVHGRDTGLIASAVAAYLRESGKDLSREKKEIKESHYIGKTGERMDLELKVVRRMAVGLGYQGGTLWLALFEDAQGNRFKWLTGGCTFQEGQTYRVRATVKGHDEYKGQKQTSLSRCQDLDELDKAKALRTEQKKIEKARIKAVNATNPGHKWEAWYGYQVGLFTLKCKHCSAGETNAPTACAKAMEKAA